MSLKNVNLTTYWQWVRAEAALIDSDGCSAVTGMKIECCFEHDLGYYYAKDAHDAYRSWRMGRVDVWTDALPIDRMKTDARFRRCLQYHSKWGMWSPMALWRWLGVRWKAQKAWDSHRARELAAASTAGR